MATRRLPERAKTMWISGWAWPIALAIFVAGCAPVGPNYRRPDVPVPERWGSQPTSTAIPELSRWWERLQDAMLTTLIEQSVKGNLDVATAKARIRQARATYRQAGGVLYPSVSASVIAERSRTAATTGTTSEGAVTSGYFQTGFDAQWEIDLFGANRRSLEAARYGMDAADEDLRATLLTLIGDVASTYVELRGLQARVDLARRMAASQQQTAALTRTRFELGAVSALDVANATGQANSTEAAIPQLEASYAQSAHRLGVLTGQAPSALVGVLEKVAAVPKPTLPVATGVPATILLARPDVRFAERQLAQSTAKIGQAEAARYPSVSLTGSIATSGLNIGDLGTSSSIGWSFGPSITVPLFNAGRLKAAVDITEAQRDQYFIAYHAAVLIALEDVENAVVSLSREEVRYSKLLAAAEAYRQAAELALLRYRNGRSAFLDVLDAERSRYSAEDALIQSQVLITQAYISLNKALGGGWDGVVDAALTGVERR